MFSFSRKGLGWELKNHRETRLRKGRSTVRRVRYGEREEERESERKGRGRGRKEICEDRRRTVSKLHLPLLLQRRARHCALPSSLTFLNDPAGPARPVFSLNTTKLGDKPKPVKASRELPSTYLHSAPNPPLRCLLARPRIV